MHLEESMVMYGVYKHWSFGKITKHCTYHAQQHHPEWKAICRRLQPSIYMVCKSERSSTLFCKHSSMFKNTKRKICQNVWRIHNALSIDTKTIRILAKEHLPGSLITPLTLQEILDEVTTAVWKTNPDYDIVIKRLCLYYDMKLITFGTDKDKNLIVQFPVFIQPYMQQLLILYQLETVLVPIIDQNTQADSFTHIQIDRPYIDLNSETCITIRQQELRTCKRIGYEFYCEDLFMVKHKSKYSCESITYFDLDPEIIKDNCKFTFYYNKTDITSTVLDGGNKNILATWPNW